MTAERIQVQGNVEADRLRDGNHTPQIVENRLELRNLG